MAQALHLNRAVHHEASSLQQRTTSCWNTRTVCVLTAAVFIFPAVCTFPVAVGVCVGEFTARLGCSDVVVGAVSGATSGAITGAGLGAVVGGASKAVSLASAGAVVGVAWGVTVCGTAVLGTCSRL